ncbi:son of sevenless homolog 1-like isoform X2 [Bolinopsis microptera]|uniref:son of sevenless homolog 1-like isoform X2 n=1 Tax=Bolinopsis microptera TaxID=2820187 RepID=UPI00307B0A82
MLTIERKVFKTDESLDQIRQFNEIVEAFQNEQNCYIQELQIMAEKIKPVFDNPKSGVNGDTVDVIFGNVCELVKVELELQSCMEEMKVITTSDTLLPVGSVFNHFAKSEQLEVYVYYGNNYAMSMNHVEKLKTEKDNLRYSFEDCVKLGFSEDAVTILLEVLLFKPIQHISYVFDTIRDLISCLKNLSKLHSESEKFATIQKDLLREALYFLDNTESAVQDVMDKFYNDYRYYPLYLVPRPSRDNPLQLLFKSYMSMIVEKKAELRLVEVTEETITISMLDKENRDIILLKQRFPITEVETVKDLHNDLNQFSVNLKDQVINLLPAKAEDKNDVVVSLTVLLCRRVFVPETRNSLLNMGRFMYSEYDEVYSGPSTSEPVLNNNLSSLVERLVQGAVTDEGFTKDFLTVFKLFTTSGILLGLLQEKFHKYKIEDAKDKEITEKTQKLKVFSILKTWILIDKTDFLRDGLLGSNLWIFLDSCKKTPWLLKWVKLIEKLIEDPTNSTKIMSIGTIDSITCLLDEEEPPPDTLWYLTKTPIKYSLLTLHPVELARQITLIEHSCFAKMRLFDIIVNEGEAVSKLREFQDRYSLWIRRSIVESRNLEERSAMFRNMFHLLKSLHSIRNYSGLMAVYNVLQSAELYRLKHSMRQLLLKFKDTLSKIEDLPKNNYEDYWKTILSETSPSIPLIGSYNRFVKESNLSFVNGEEVNFEACLKMSDKVENITLLQKRAFNFTCQESIKGFLLEVCPYERKTRKEFLSDLYDKSLTVEPFNGPPSFFKRVTDYDLSWDPVEFFGWKSTSVKPKGGPSVDKATEKFNLFAKKVHEQISESEDEDDPVRIRKGSTLTKSKSFCSRRLDEPPPLPPRVAAINKSNCLSRSRSFNTENRSPYDMYVLPEKRPPITAGIGDRGSPIYIQSSPLNSPILYGHNSPVYGHHSPVYGHNSPVYGHNSPIYGHNSPVYREAAHIYAQVPQLYEQMQNPARKAQNSPPQDKPKQRVRPNVRPVVQNVGSPSPNSFVRSTVQTGKASPSPPLRRSRANSSKSKVPRKLGLESPPPALPQKTRQTTLRRRVAVPPPEYDIPDESYDTIENYPMRPPPIPPKVCKPPPIPPRA